MNAHNHKSPASAIAPAAAFPAVGREPLAAPTYPCPECNGSGEVCWFAGHPDDPRADRTAECDYCGGSGEIEDEPEGWELAEQAALAMPSARSGGLRPEPCSTVSAVPAPAAIARGESREG